MNKEISFEDIKDFEEDFSKDRANTLAMNAATSNGINAAAMSHEAKAVNQFGFSVEVEAGKVCNQKQSGPLLDVCFIQCYETRDNEEA